MEYLDTIIAHARSRLSALGESLRSLMESTSSALRDCIHGVQHGPTADRWLQWAGKTLMTMYHQLIYITDIAMYRLRGPRHELVQIKSNIWELRIFWSDRPVFIRFRRPRGPVRFNKNVLPCGKNISIESIPYCDNNGSPLKILSPSAIFAPLKIVDQGTSSALGESKRGQ